MTDQKTADAVKVTVLDEQFRIRSEADEEYTRRVASHVDAALRELRRAVPTLEPFQTAVLGAMEISDELFRAGQRPRARGARETNFLSQRVLTGSLAPSDDHKPLARK